MKANLNRFVNAFNSFVSNHLPLVFRTMSPTRAPSTLPLLEKRCAKFDMGTQHWPEPGRQEPQCWHRPSRSSCTWPSSTIPPRVWLLTTCKLLTCGPNLGIFPLWKVQKIKSHFYSGRSAQIRKLKKTNQVQDSISYQNPSVQVLILIFDFSPSPNGYSLNCYYYIIRVQAVLKKPCWQDIHLCPDLLTGSSGKNEVHKCWKTVAISSGLGDNMQGQTFSNYFYSEPMINADLKFVATITTSSRVKNFQLCKFFQKTTSFLANLRKNMKFTHLFGRFTHIFSKTMEILHFHFNFSKKMDHSYLYWNLRFFIVTKNSPNLRIFSV